MRRRSTPLVAAALLLALLLATAAPTKCQMEEDEASLSPPEAAKGDDGAEESANGGEEGSGENASMTIALDEFKAVRSCLPFNLLLAPSDDNETYAIAIEADGSVAEAINASVVDGVLAIGTVSGFNATGPIKATVTMPKGALQNLDKNSASDVVLAPGFELPSLTIMSSVVGRYLVFGVTVDELTIESAGTAVVYVEGKIGAARASASGTGSVFLKGVTDSVDVDGSDIARIVIDAAKKDVKISGTVSQLAQVFTTDGDCAIQGGRSLVPPCTITKSSSLPEFDPKFSCGLIVDGNISCTPSSISGSSVLASDSPTTTTFTSTSGSGASASASATASGDPDDNETVSSMSHSIGDFGALVSTENGDGIAVAVAAQRCNATDEDLKMLSDSR